MKEIFKSRVFWFGLTLKVICMPFWGSEYMRELFIPFIDNALIHPFSNPWARSLPHYFPYGSAAFIVLFIPKFIGYKLLGSLAIGQSSLSLFLMKFPLLIADIVFLQALVRFSPKSIRLLLLFYWLNPVLFFINYIHGQLDILSILFCFMSVQLLIENRHVFSAIMMALATLSKFHVVIVIPLMMAYVWNNEFLKQAIQKMGGWLIVWLGISVLGFLPVLLAKTVGYVTVGSPQAMQFFSLRTPVGETNVFYFGVALVALTLGRLALSTKISGRGLVYSVGLVFGLLLFVVDPAPGWYFWVVPFLALYYSTYFTNQPILFGTLLGLYFLYFCVISSYGLGLFPTFWGVGLTLLQTALLGTLVDLWSVVLRNEMPVLGRMKPILIGVSGDSGAGKNTFSLQLEKLFGPSNTVLLEGDDYHRWVRGTEKWNFYTHLNPKANQLPVLAHHMKELIRGRFIFHPKYDHQTGEFTSPREIRPNKTVIIQGLHTLYLKNMRESFDLKVFMFPDESLRMYWKIQRDVKERGHTLESVLEAERKRKEDAKNHIDPQKQHADWIVEVYPLEDLSKLDPMTQKPVPLGVRHTLWNHSPIFELSQALKNTGSCTVSIVNQPEDIDRLILDVQGTLSSAEIERVARHLFPNLRQLTRGRREPTWLEGIQGINQLITLTLLQSMHQ
ncbi:MAG: Uridine kinase [Elusimicrobia bacterium]|nr:Uridine kinase [Elusimicrobiota bacterium]